MSLWKPWISYKIISKTNQYIINMSYVKDLGFDHNEKILGICEFMEAVDIL